MAIFTYDLNTDAGKVRLLIPDNQSSDFLFNDDEINAFLTLESSNIRRAAAMAVEAIARNEVLVLKVIKLLDLQTDGAAVARELRQQARDLREQAQMAEGAEAGGLFDFAEWAVDGTQAQNILWNDALRTN